VQMYYDPATTIDGCHSFMVHKREMANSKGFDQRGQNNAIGNAATIWRSASPARPINQHAA
jgi:hypothetical protein